MRRWWSRREALIGPVSRDSTAIEGREVAKPKKTETPKGPRKDEERSRRDRRPRLERQADGLDAMLADLPKARGTKKNARGIRETRRGSLSTRQTAGSRAILTSASVNDSLANPGHSDRGSRPSTISWTPPMTRQRYTRSAKEVEAAAERIGQAISTIIGAQPD